MSKERARVTNACDFCKKRKVKCVSHEGEACFTCLAYNETCQFTKVNKKRGPQRGYAEDLENRIEEMEKLVQAKGQEDTIQHEIERNKRIIRQRKRLQINKPTQSNQTMLSNLFEEYGLSDPNLLGIEPDSIHYLSDLSTFQFLGDKIGQQKWGDYKIKRFGDDMVLVYEGKKQELSKLEVEWPKELDPVREDLHKYIYSMTGVDKHTSSRLLKIYFANIHPTLPLIDKTEFINQYRGRSDTYPSGELLNSIFGAAARFVEGSHESRKRLPIDAQWDSPKNWSLEFFDKAEHLITQSPVPTLSKLQAILLVVHHRKDRNVKFSDVWQMVGLAIRIGQLLGLHRDCEHWDIPPREKETRKRVWWALYMTDVFQSSMLGRSVSLRDEDMTVGYPDATADWEEVMDAYADDKEKILSKEPFPRFPSLVTYIPIATIVGNRIHIYELFIQLIKLSRIVSGILLGLHTPKAKKFSFEHGSDSIVTMLDRELTEWRYNFLSVIKNSQIPDFSQKEGHFAPTVASILLFYFGTLILLHQPFIKKTLSKSSTSSLQICASAASRGIRIAQTMSTTDFLMFPYAFGTYPLRQFSFIHIFNAKNPNPYFSSTAKEDLVKGHQLAKQVESLSLNASLTAKLYGALIVHLEDFEKSRQAENTGSTVPVEESIYPENLSMLPTMPNTSCNRLGINEEAFSLSQFGFNTMSDIGLQDLQNMPEDYEALMYPQNTVDLGCTLFRNDPTNLFWSLPTEIDMDALTAWLNSMNDVEWLSLEQ